MIAKHRILIADDHALLRAELRTFLSGEPDLDVVGEAANGRDAVQAVGQISPHVVLLDFTTPGMTGIEALTQIKSRYPKVRVLVITIHDTEEFIQACRIAGADGAIRKNAIHEELLTAIRTVLQQPAISLSNMRGNGEEMIHFGDALSILFEYVANTEQTYNRRRDSQPLSHRAPVRMR